MQTELRTRHIVIKFILDENTFAAGTDKEGNPLNVKIIRGNSDSNSLTIEANINKTSTSFMQSSATVIIDGMTVDDINTLSLMQFQVGVNEGYNIVEIYAGYDLNSDGLPPLAYRGQIYAAYPDYNNANRSRPFKVMSLYGITYQNADDNGHISVKGEVKLEDLFKQIASQFKGLQFVGNNLFGYSSTNPRYEGTPVQQMDKACADYGYHWKADDTSILVAPKYQPFYPNEIIEISSDNNMIGYPTAVPYGFQVMVRYTPYLKFGQVVKIKSLMPFANNGAWYINGIQHILTNHSNQFMSILQVNNYLFGGM